MPGFRIPRASCRRRRYLNDDQNEPPIPVGGTVTKVSMDCSFIA